MRALGLGHLTNMNQNPQSDQYGFTQLDTNAAANPGPDRAQALSDFYALPGYTWRVGQGVNALDRSAASRGMLASGAQQKAITDYGQNQGSQEWGNYINQLMGLSGQGAGSAANVNNTNTASSNSENNALLTGGLAQAGTIQNGANALGSGINSAINDLGSIVGYTGFGKNAFATSAAKV